MRFGLRELGQTWSQPLVVKTNANSGNPIAFLGGGYDNVSEDVEPPATVDVVGRAVYALDAFTGTPIWSAVKTGAVGAGTTFCNGHGLQRGSGRAIRRPDARRQGGPSVLCRRRRYDLAG